MWECSYLWNLVWCEHHSQMCVPSVCPKSQRERAAWLPCWGTSAPYIAQTYRVMGQWWFTDINMNLMSSFLICIKKLKFKFGHYMHFVIKGVLLWIKLQAFWIKEQYPWNYFFLFFKICFSNLANLIGYFYLMELLLLIIDYKIFNACFFPLKEKKLCRQLLC